MDDKATVKELKEKVKKFCEARDWDKYHISKDLAIAISTESSELLEHFRWKTEKEIEEMFNSLEKKKQIEHELADILHFILRFAQTNNIDLSDALEEKLKINEERYPVEKFKGSNKKYNEM